MALQSHIISSKLEMFDESCRYDIMFPKDLELVDPIGKLTRLKQHTTFHLYGPGCVSRQLKLMHGNSEREPCQNIQTLIDSESTT